MVDPLDSTRSKQPIYMQTWVNEMIYQCTVVMVQTPMSGLDTQDEKIAVFEHFTRNSTAVLFYDISNTSWVSNIEMSGVTDQGYQSHQNNKLGWNYTDVDNDFTIKANF